MTRQHSRPERSVPRWTWIAGALALVAVAAVAVALLASGRSGSAANGEERSEASDSPAITHIHGLGGDPADGSVYVATHEGLYRIEADGDHVEPVGNSRDDFMGFSMLDAKTFLASGHPAPGGSRPQDLGLIRSDDGGLGWRAVSLSGEADFHLLRARERHVYGFSGELLVSEDGGRSWTGRDSLPGKLYDLAISPSDPRFVAISTDDGIYTSSDAAKTWRRAGAAAPGLLAWPARGRLFLVDAGGEISESRDAGRRWRAAGSIGGGPVVFAVAGARLLAALEDNSIVVSDDFGRSWRRIYGS